MNAQALSFSLSLYLTPTASFLSELLLAFMFSGKYVRTFRFEEMTCVLQLEQTNSALQQPNLNVEGLKSLVMAKLDQDRFG